MSTRSGTFFNIKFRSATSSSNFPISLRSFTALSLDVSFNTSNLDLNLSAYMRNLTTPPPHLYDKFRLVIKLFIDYRLNIEKLKPVTITFEQLQEKFGSRKIMDFSSNKYMRSTIDSSQLDLLEHLDNLALGDLKNSIPNLINWSDAHIGKNSSGYCAVRNAYQHPDLYKITKDQLAKLFDLPSEFNTDGSINRSSGNNKINLEASIIPILKEIQTFFNKKYFENTPLPFDEIVLF